MDTTDALKLKLTKIENYTLKPFGHFDLKWSPSEKLAKQFHILPLCEISFDSNTGMPYTAEDEKLFVKYMKKYKTDVFVDQRDLFYSRIGDYWVEIRHKKLSEYNYFLCKSNLTDSEESWNAYMKSKI